LAWARRRLPSSANAWFLSPRPSDDGAVAAAVPAKHRGPRDAGPGTDVPARRRTVALSPQPLAARAGAAGGVTLRLRPDVAWLRDPATQFPVTVDPQISGLHPSFDTYVREGDTVGRSGANDLQIGLLAGSPVRKARSFVHWPTGAIAGKQVTAATVKFWNFWSHTCTANGWQIWTTGAASSSTRWGTQPVWSFNEASSTETKGFSSACDDPWVSHTTVGPAASRRTAHTRYRRSIGHRVAERQRFAATGRNLAAGIRAATAHRYAGTDRNPRIYSVEVLARFKADHEARLVPKKLRPVPPPLDVEPVDLSLLPVSDLPGTVWKATAIGKVQTWPTTGVRRREFAPIPRAH
jgi:hypothetical protein